MTSFGVSQDVPRRDRPGRRPADAGLAIPSLEAFEGQWRASFFAVPYRPRTGHAMCAI